MSKTIVYLAATLLCSLHLHASGNGLIDRIRDSFIETSACNYSPNDSVTRNFIEYSDYGRANDVLLLQLYMSVHLPDDEVERLFSLFSADGSFTDIDYTDRTRGRWQPTLHLTRLYSLTKLYVSKESHWHGDSRLSGLIHSGLEFWFSLMPTSDNWWHNEIGVPRKATSILLMLGDEATEKEKQGCLKLLEKSPFGRTGQNKVWLATNNLMKGLLTGDEGLVRKAHGYICEEIAVTEDEGIQPDWSFHQHGPQIQFGNYGLTYAESVSFLIRVLDGSELEFNDSQYATVANMLKEGICWSVYRGVMDPSFCGRQVFINSGRGKAYSVAVAAQNMAAAGKGDSRFFTGISDENLMPEKFGNTLTGSRYYWRSDCGIYRAPDWYASIRMHSERTIGFEFTNRENLNAWFSADGALLFMQHGSEYENIFAHWDWRSVPGTTSYDDGRPLRTSDRREDKMNRTPHVGGVSADSIMCTTMEICRDSLHAFKSVFFFDDAVIALGSGIYTENPDVLSVSTALDQTNLSGKVKSGKDWAWHDGRGYVLLRDGTRNTSGLEVTTDLQKGKWDPIDPFYKDCWQEGRVFKCRVSHNPDKVSSYAYAILPHRTAKETRSFLKGNGIKVLRNDSTCQEISYRGYVCRVTHCCNGKPSVSISRNGKIIRSITLPEPADKKLENI